jgi:SAM-dependent methyltransferase
MERVLGDRTVKRGVAEYTYLLFPDDLSGKALANKLLEYYLPSKYDVFRYFNPNETVIGEGQQKSAPDIRKTFGGQKNFFQKGSQILDVGSGIGKATYEYSRIKKGVKITALDPIFLRREIYNTSKGNYVAGKWSRLPFKDSSFSGILCCESFPRWENVSEEDDSVFKEITRVAQKNAIWRATRRKPMPFITVHSGQVINSTPQEDIESDIITKHLLNNGWETYITNGLFIARLINK